MSTLVLVCGNVVHGLSDALTGPAEILIEGNRITKIERSVGRPPGARVIDLSERTVTRASSTPMSISRWTPLTSRSKPSESLCAKALKGLNLAREYMGYGFTTLRDLGSVSSNGRRLTFAMHSTRAL